MLYSVKPTAEEKPCMSFLHDNDNISLVKVETETANEIINLKNNNTNSMVGGMN